MLNAKPQPNRRAVDRCNVIIFVFARSIYSIAEFSRLKDAGRSLKENFKLVSGTCADNQSFFYLPPLVEVELNSFYPLPPGS